jgi:hypothetical protein
LLDEQEIRVLDEAELEELERQVPDLRVLDLDDRVPSRRCRWHL